MNMLVLPNYLINLDQIAYVSRMPETPNTVIRIHFAAITGARGELGPLDLELRGADADQLIERLTRKPNEDPQMGPS